MKIKTDQRIRQIDIKVAGVPAGLLEKKAPLEFTYHSDAQIPVAAAMPLDARFDIRDDGSCRAMEDMAVMQGKSTNDKYHSSYETISKVPGYYSSDVKSDNETLFKMLVHSCMTGNGDAHLKNYAMLYDDIEDMRLSPLYDVVNTQIYTR